MDFVTCFRNLRFSSLLNRTKECKHQRKPERIERESQAIDLCEGRRESLSQQFIWNLLWLNEARGQTISLFAENKSKAIKDRKLADRASRPHGQFQARSCDKRHFIFKIIQHNKGDGWDPFLPLMINFGRTISEAVSAAFECPNESDYFNRSNISFATRCFGCASANLSNKRRAGSDLGSAFNRADVIAKDWAYPIVKSSLIRALST